MSKPSGLCSLKGMFEGVEIHFSVARCFSAQGSLFLWKHFCREFEVHLKAKEMRRECPKGGDLNDKGEGSNIRK